MDCRNGVVATLLGVMVGTVMGAGATHYAQLITSGYNPNVVEGVDTGRPDADEFINSRRAEDNAALSRPLNRAPVTEVEPMHEAAPAKVEISIPVKLRHCEGLSGSRYTHCVGEYMKDGTFYQRSQDR
jgi:hypothetical protein